MAECKEHSYHPEVEKRKPIWDTGISHCLTCVWAWADWLESMLDKHGGHTADCDILKPTTRTGCFGMNVYDVKRKCDCGWQAIADDMEGE